MEMRVEGEVVFVISMLQGLRVGQRHGQLDESLLQFLGMQSCICRRFAARRGTSDWGGDHCWGLKNGFVQDFCFRENETQIIV